MLTRWQFGVTTALALVSAAVAGYAMWLANENRSLQIELAGRSQYVQQTAQLEGLYRGMVKALAELSVRDQDRSLNELLASNGITLGASNDTVPPVAQRPAESGKAVKR